MITFSKKIYSLIFVALCSFAIAQSVPLNNQEGLTQQEETPIHKYYTINPWDYLDTQLIDSIDKQQNSFYQLCVKNGIILSVFFITGGFVANNDTHRLISFLIALLSGFTYSGWLEKHLKIKALEKILTNYSADTTDQKFNTRNCIPKDLQPVFDTLAIGYSKGNTKYLNDHAHQVINEITQKIIFKIKYDHKYKNKQLYNIIKKLFAFAIYTIVAATQLDFTKEILKNSKSSKTNANATKIFDRIYEQIRRTHNMQI